ncbi:MAG: cation:dicarboxylase symporter family transporter [Deltaproteobacteria bacterium]|nr:cation:dicarboxylase symporter family transporter [Deltaproteobacteria bacterium]
MEPDIKQKKRLSLSAQIMIGMGLGIVAGVFFGDYCAPLQIIGDAFIKLLQITILPYIIVSMILGIGGLTPEQAKLMAKKAGILLLLFWGISFAMVLGFPLTFPEWKSAAFFSSAIVELPKKVDFLSLYIPSNPFHSLANNVVPAVVLFSILMGIALMGMQKKEVFLEALGVAAQALVGMTNLIVKLTPVGVFAITAAAAGTMTIEEFGRLQVYLISFNVAAIFLTFWVLPMLVTSLTPFKYRDVVGMTRDALVTAFTTGNLFVVLTVLTEGCKQLFENYDLKKDKTDTYVDVLVPISFNFPNTGKLLMLLFILFAAWFSGSTFSLAQYPSFVISGLLSFFGGVDVAMPFMLDLMKIPSDMYQLYVVTGVINGRFASLLAAMNLVIFTLLATASLTGVMTLNKKKLINYVVVSLLLTAGLIGGTRLYFSMAVKNVYTKDQVIANMQSMVFPVPRDVYKSMDEEGIRPLDLSKPALQRIRESGVLRVGYDPDNLPFTYFSEIGELIGFDVDMAQLLARELKVKLEFVPIDRETLAEQMESGVADVAMSGFVMTTPRLETIVFSAPYLETTLAFIVRDHLRSEFATADAIREITDLKIGIPAAVADYFHDRIKAYLPQSEIVAVDSVREFFETNEKQLDALLLDAEGGAALTLLYPRFAVVVPIPDVMKIPLAYAVAGRDREFADFLSQWITLKKSSLDFPRLYDHWILGRDAEPKHPRWSILRDVLEWVQ